MLKPSLNKLKLVAKSRGIKGCKSLREKLISTPSESESAREGK